MKMYYLNVKKQVCGIVDIEPKLDEYYKLIDCDCITITTIQILGHIYDVICDDEALLKDDPIPAILVCNGYSIYGNVLICKDDCEGNETGLDFYDVDRISNSIYLSTRDGIAKKVIVCDDIFDEDKI